MAKTPTKRRKVSGTKSKGGRPPKLVANEHTLRLVGAAAQIRASHRETAAFFGVSTATFEKFMQRPEVRAVWEKGEAEGLMGLRRSQFALAQKNAQMSIHLGKVYLGQEDRSHVSIDGSIDLGAASATLAARLARQSAQPAASGSDGVAPSPGPADE